jgi:hypothetical protein
MVRWPDMGMRWDNRYDRPVRTPRPAVPSGPVSDAEWAALGTLIDTRWIRMPREIPQPIQHLIARQMAEVVTLSGQQAIAATPIGDLAYLDHAQAPALRAAHLV